MELNEFLEKFLPDYKQKKKNYLIEAKLISFAHNKDYNSEEVIRVCTEYTFNNKYFPETLQNFADKLCEKQRENCLKNTDNANSHLTYMNGINSAEQPKIDEL